MSSVWFVCLCAVGEGGGQRGAPASDAVRDGHLQAAVGRLRRAHGWVSVWCPAILSLHDHRRGVCLSLSHVRHRCVLTLFFPFLAFILQEAMDLRSSALRRWAKRRGCPGVTPGEFTRWCLKPGVTSRRLTRTFCSQLQPAGSASLQELRTAEGEAALCDRGDGRVRPRVMNVFPLYGDASAK